jgi:hypothetical protein
MRSPLKQTAASLTIFALILWIAPSPSVASSGTARLEGLLVGVDGHPATEMNVHLIDAQGQDVAQSATSDEGIYTFADLPPGEYSLGIENAEGQMAPVAAPPVKLGESELARRDLQLMEADPAQVNQAAVANYGIGQWWASLSPAAKAWSIVAIIAVVGITAAAVSSTSEEQTGSPSE